jgi:hypothetical protein
VGESSDSDEDSPSDRKGASETALLELYTTLREEILRNGDSQARRNTRGVATMIVLIGYAVNFEQPAVVALVPVVFSYLLIRSFESLIWTYNIAYQLSRIERELSEPGSAMRYEIKRGGVASDDLDGSTKRFRDFPGWGRVVLGSLAYVSSLVVPLVVWEQIETPTVAGFAVTQESLLVGYVFLSLTTGAAGVSLYVYRDRLRAAIRRDSEPESPLSKQSDTDEQNDGS